MSADTNPPMIRSRDNRDSRDSGGNGSGDVKINLTRWGVVIGTLAAIIGLAGAWFVLPYRVEAAEKRIDAVDVRVDRVENELRTQRDLLIRIDANVAALKEKRAP